MSQIEEKQCRIWHSLFLTPQMLSAPPDKERRDLAGLAKEGVRQPVME